VQLPLYLPCLDEECCDLLQQNDESGDPDIADHLSKSLDAARQSRREQLTSQMNFTHLSRKRWADSPTWCCSAASRIMATHSIPKIRRNAKVIAIKYLAKIQNLRPVIAQSLYKEHVISSWSVLPFSIFLLQSKSYLAQIRLVSRKPGALMTSSMP